MPIDLNETAEQRAILASLRRVLQDHFDPARLLGADCVDAGRLARLRDFGALAMGADESVGGAGLSLVEEVQVFIELGRHLLTPAALAAAVAGRLAAATGQAGLARDIVAGRQPVCCVLAAGMSSPPALEAVAAHLVDAQGAPLALWWGHGGTALLRTDALEPQAPVASIDRTLELVPCRLRASAVVACQSAGAGSLHREADLLVAAQQLGIAQATRDMAVAYATLRRQFGQPIGAFQAIKHRCANMAIKAEVLCALLMFATMAQRDGWDDAAHQVDACRLLATRYALENARDNIQIHGGTGFSAQSTAHLFLLRCHLYEHLGGAGDALVQRLADGAAAGAP